jgi:pimeloyl-ACP methyl ester carboxylesterase
MHLGKAQCNGVVLNYRSVGDGSDVVLIHGLATNHAFWRFDVLLSLAKAYRVTVYDLRGHGHSEMPKEGYDSGHMVADLHHLLNHLHITKAHLVGHSLGGVIALHYAALHPERIKSITIADSRIRALQPTNYPRDWPNFDAANKKLQEIGLHVPEDESESGLWLLEQIASPKWQKERHKLEGSSLFIPFGGWNGGQRTAVRWLELLNKTTAKNDFTLTSLTLDLVESIRQPVLLVYGQNSPTLPSCYGLRDHLPDCETSIIPGAGHFYPLTRPKIFVDRVNKFIKEMEGQGCC